MASSHVIIEDVSWETYERLLIDTGTERRKLFTYGDGIFQIAVPALQSEQANRSLALIVEMVACEWGLDLDACGSATVLRADLRKGFEPDSSFYIRNAAAVRGKDELDFAVDPPPDLVIEIDITRDSMNKFPIFAAVGVPEVWRYDKTRVAIHTLGNGGEYSEATQSEMLPPLTGELLTAFLKAGLEQDRPIWVRGLQEWARGATRS